MFISCHEVKGHIHEATFVVACFKYYNKFIVEYNTQYAASNRKVFYFHVCATKLSEFCLM